MVFSVLGFSHQASLTASAQSEKGEVQLELDQERADKADLFSWRTLTVRAPSFMRRPSLSASQSTIVPDEKEGEILRGENVEALLQKLSAKEQELEAQRTGKEKVSELVMCVTEEIVILQKVRA
jgi:hypothetical protein